MLLFIQLKLEYFMTIVIDAHDVNQAVWVHLRLKLKAGDEMLNHLEVHHSQQEIYYILGHIDGFLAS